MDKTTIELWRAGRYQTATRKLGKRKYEVRWDGAVVGVGDWTRATATFERVRMMLFGDGWKEGFFEVEPELDAQMAIDPTRWPEHNSCAQRATFEK